MMRLLLGFLLIFSVNVLEASPTQQTKSDEKSNPSNEIAIGYNPTDFTIVGKSLSGSALTDIVISSLSKASCPNNNSYIIVGSEDSKVMNAIKKETELSSSSYADPNTKLRPNILKATHLLKGDAVFNNGNVSINLRLEDTQGCLWYQTEISGTENNFYKLVDNSTRLLGKQICMSKPQVQTCLKSYYTVTTSKKTTKTLKPIENYRGIDKDLKSYEEDKDTYYIYVDEDNARIVQLHIDSKSTRKIHRESYELNTKSCKYEVKKEDDFIKNMGGSPILESEDAGWGFEDDTKFYVNLPSLDKELSFTWGRLKKSGHYSKSIKYKEKIPKLAKEIIGKVNDMATEYRDGAKNSELIAFWKAGVDALASSKEEGCPAKVSFESMLIPPVDGMQDPDVEFKINIRPSTKSEIKILKNRMNIK